MQIRSTPLYTNAAYLIGAKVVSASFGLIFWIVVARLYAAQDVGVASALFSVVLLLSFMSRFGWSFGLVRFLYHSGSDASALINSCFTLSGLAAVVVAGIFLAGLPLWSPRLSFVQENPLFIAAFVVFVVSGTIYNLLTHVFVAMRRAEVILISEFILGLLKFVALAIIVMGVHLSPTFSIFATWGLGLAVTVIGLLLFMPRLQQGYKPAPSLLVGGKKEFLRFSFANYVSDGLWRAPIWLLPLMLVTLIGGEANAYSYVTWAIVGHLFQIPIAMSQSLFSEGSHDVSSLARDFKKSLKLTGALLFPAVVVMLVAGDKLLLLFGREYSTEGVKLLWLLVLSALPVSVNVLYLGVARVERRLKNIILVTAGVSLGTLILSYVLIPPLGILGPGIAWMASHSLVAVAVLPSIIKLLYYRQDGRSCDGLSMPVPELSTMITKISPGRD